MPFLLPLLPAIGAATSAASGIAGAAGALSNAAKPQVGPQTAPIDKGVSNQNVANAMGQTSGAMNQQQQLANQLAGQNGIGNQSSVYNQQQGLANQLGLMAQGQGPSPAQAQLANSTGQNVANQAALMAGQRGAGANVGLMARQAAQQGAATQQQGAGQAAALKQQEQLNAIGALQQQQGMLGNLATQQVGQQTGAIGNLNQFAQGNQSQLLNAQQGQNATAAGQQGNINSINAANGQQQNQFNQQNFQGLQSGLGSAVTALGAKPASGRPAGVAGPMKPDGSFAMGGQVPIMKENYKGNSKLGAHLHHYATGGRIDFTQGGDVPGTPQVNYDSSQNDTVKAMVSPGEIVLPLSVTQAADPVTASAKFVAALQSKGKR